MKYNEVIHRTLASECELVSRCMTISPYKGTQLHLDNGKYV